MQNNITLTKDEAITALKALRVHNAVAAINSSMGNGGHIEIRRANELIDKIRKHKAFA